MRRKKLADRDPSIAELLGPEGLMAARPDDPSMPYPLRIAAHRRWMDKRADWVARRERYALEHGWPGGDYARHLEENEAHPVPDAPFDPNWEMLHGGL